MTNDWVTDFDFVDKDHGWASWWYYEDYPLNEGDVTRWIPEKKVEGKKEERYVLMYDNMKICEGTLKVYDLSGREIVVLKDGFWDGKDSNGKDVPKGIYFGVKENEKIKIIKIKN
uniref:Uncharacterized protein n=1 Tax=candidate division WOR-3 bacterium TaxID=2052148 RepID=A0A7C4YGS9_UNCW3